MLLFHCDTEIEAPQVEVTGLAGDLKDTQNCPAKTPAPLLQRVDALTRTVPSSRGSAPCEELGRVATACPARRLPEPRLFSRLLVLLALMLNRLTSIPDRAVAPQSLPLGLPKQPGVRIRRCEEASRVAPACVHPALSRLWIPFVVMASPMFFYQKAAGDTVTGAADGAGPPHYSAGAPWGTGRGPPPGTSLFLQGFTGSPAGALPTHLSPLCCGTATGTSSQKLHLERQRSVPCTLGSWNLKGNRVDHGWNTPSQVPPSCRQSASRWHHQHRRTTSGGQQRVPGAWRHSQSPKRTHSST